MTNLHKRMFCRTLGSNPRLSEYQADAHPTELLGPAEKIYKCLYHIYGWWLSWSCDIKHSNKFSSPLHFLRSLLLQLFSYKSIRSHIWPVGKVKGQSRVIIWTGFRVLGIPMLQTVSLSLLVWLWKNNFRRFLLYTGNSGHVTSTVPWNRFWSPWPKVAP